MPLCVGWVGVVGLSLVVWLCGAALTGRASWAEALRANPPRAVRQQLWGTAHLWYLQYLFALAVLQIPLDVWARRADDGDAPHFARVLGLYDRLAASRWRWVPVSCGVAWVLACDPAVYLGFQHGFAPFAGKFAHAAVCFFFGWLCGRNRAALAGHGRDAAGLLFAAACACGAVIPLAHAAAAGDVSARWLAVPVGLVAGLAVTAALTHGAASRTPARPAVARLAAASFWVYLVHHPLVGALHLGLWFVDIPPDLECGLVLLIAVGLCVLAEPLSRTTRPGRLLTGRGWTLPEPAAEPATVPLPVPAPGAAPARRAA